MLDNKVIKREKKKFVGQRTSCWRAKTTLPRLFSVGPDSSSLHSDKGWVVCGRIVWCYGWARLRRLGKLAFNGQAGPNRFPRQGKNRGEHWLQQGDSVISIGGHRHRSQFRRYPISDIDICYSDIGDKYVGLKNVIPISEVFRYQHQSLFRYPTLKKKIYTSLQIQTHAPWNEQRAL